MKPIAIFQEFETIASKLGIRIIQEKGDFKGGYCLLEEERIIVLNKHKPIEQRIRSLAIVFSYLDTSRIFLKPIIREMIESEENSFTLDSVK